MKKFLAAILTSSLVISASAQTKFDYNVDFAYLFNNSEYTDGDTSMPYDESHTLNSARLTPSVGLTVSRKPNVLHRLSAGVDLVRDMGSGMPISDTFRELTLNYSVTAELKRGRFDAVAGIFPRSFSEGSWRWLFYSDDNLFYDNNLEGVYFKWRSRRFRAELGLDWMGRHGDDANPERREQFKVLSAGDWNFAGGFSLAWSACFHHFACSQVAYEIVDDHMLNPRLEWRTRKTWFDNLGVTVGAALSYQFDRKSGSDPLLRTAVTSTQEVSKFGIKLSNYLFVGEDFMPYYQKYGSSLYSGSRCFNTRVDGWSVADILQVGYEPRICEWLSVVAACNFHLGTPDPDRGLGVLRGSQQILGLKVNLDCFREHAKPLKHNRKHRPTSNVDSYAF